MKGHGPDSSGSGDAQLAESGKHGNEPSDSTNYDAFLN